MARAVKAGIARLCGRHGRRPSKKTIRRHSWRCHLSVQRKSGRGASLCTHTATARKRADHEDPAQGAARAARIHKRSRRAALQDSGSCCASPPNGLVLLEARRPRPALLRRRGTPFRTKPFLKWPQWSLSITFPPSAPTSCYISLCLFL